MKISTFFSFPAFFVWYLFSSQVVLWAASDLTKDSLITVVGWNPKQWDHSTLLTSLFKFVKSEVALIVAICAIAAFLYVGIRMASARWNPEEFKKAWIHFIYIIVGLFIALFAVSAVQIISSLKI